MHQGSRNVPSGVLGVLLVLACSSDPSLSYDPSRMPGSTGSQSNGSGTSGDGGWSLGQMGDGAASGGTGAPSTGGTSSPGSGGGSTAGAYACLKNADDPSCAGQLYVGQGLPLDLYVMFDQSGSMAIKDDGATMRIDAVRGAVDQFMKAPEGRAMGVGIGYFGQQPLMCGCTSCNPADYATPSVPIGLLPDHAAAVMGSLNKIEPTGETPTGAAIRGACSYAKARKQAEPGRNVVLLLVTDGEPQAPVTAAKGGCNPTLSDAAAAAAECAAAGVKTYVLGIGPALQNLNMIAAAGMTEKAYLVASGGGSEILKALNAIRSDAIIPCGLQIPRPSGGALTVDFKRVNVVFADAACKVTTFLHVQNAAGCNPQTGGWYYDNPAQPSQIQLCKATCDQVKAPGGQLVVTVGCATKVIP